MADKKEISVGRKKSTDKKIPVQVYVRSSVVENIGGIAAAREIALAAIENAPVVKPA